MKLPNIRIKVPDLPRPVLISVGVLAAVTVLLGILVPLLGGAFDTAVAANKRLKTSIDQTTKDLATVNADYVFVTDNLDHFEKLIQGDRLVPHTRRDALKQIQALAQDHGLTTLNADFGSGSERPQAARPAQNDAFRLNVEAIKLKVGSPLDGQIYGFLADLPRSFPGSAILLSMKLARPEKVTPEMLAGINKPNSAIVTGEMEILWRTAQANEPEKKP